MNSKTLFTVRSVLFAASLSLVLVATTNAFAGRPYVYHDAIAFSRSHALSQAIARKELGKAGLEISSAPAAWEHVAVNSDTVVVVTNVPLSQSKTYVHVIAMSNTPGPAQKWAAEIMQKIKNSKMVLQD